MRDTSKFSSSRLCAVAVGALMLASMLGVSTASASTPPTIESESVSGVTGTNAILEAQIDPHESNAYYQFQLVENTGEYASEILCPEPPEPGPLCLGPPAAGALPIGFLFEGEMQASLKLSSAGVTLTPGATYHYRVIAATAIQTEDTIEWEEPTVFGEDKTFTTPQEASLTVDIEEGEGTVVSNPAGILCSEPFGETFEDTCVAAFEEGSKVTLTASPAPGYLFKGWKKCDSGGVNGRQCTVTTTSEPKEVGARFIPAFSLDATKSISNGILSTSPGGVNCGYGCLSSSALYKEGPITVKTKPAKHFHFVEFANGTGSAAVCSGSEGATCSFTIDEDSAIEEVYAEDAKNTLSLSKTGGGQGFVKTKPTTINCGYTCNGAEGEFFAAETVPVTVTLNKGTTSVAWTTSAGSCTGNSLSCTVPMSSSHTLVAKFE